MFDIGGWEFLLIAVLGIIIIGPKELPGAIRTVSTVVRRARELARDFQSGLEEVAREAEFDKVTEEFKGMTDPSSAIGDFRDEIENTIDPDREIRRAAEFDRDWTDDDLADTADGTPEDGNRLTSDAPGNRDTPPEAEPAGDGDADEETEPAEPNPRAAS